MARGRKDGSTRERIISCALDLFNRDGVARVSTNRIAEAVGISPGNLYYHFRNKEDVILAIFERFDAEKHTLLKGPDAGAITIDRALGYLDGTVGLIRKYGFIYRGIADLAVRDDRLADSYRRVLADSIANITAILIGMERASLLRPLVPDQRRFLADNLWIVAFNCLAFLNDRGEVSGAAQEDVRETVLHLCALVAPHLTEAAAAAMASFMVADA